MQKCVSPIYVGRGAHLMWLHSMRYKRARSVFPVYNSATSAMILAKKWKLKLEAISRVFLCVHWGWACSQLLEGKRKLPINWGKIRVEIVCTGFKPEVVRCISRVYSSIVVGFWFWTLINYPIISDFHHSCFSRHSIDLFSQCTSLIVEWYLTSITTAGFPSRFLLLEIIFIHHV